MAYIVMPEIAMAYIVLAKVVMAYEVSHVLFHELLDLRFDKQPLTVSRIPLSSGDMTQPHGVYHPADPWRFNKQP